MTLNLGMEKAAQLSLSGLIRDQKELHLCASCAASHTLLALRALASEERSDSGNTDCDVDDRLDGRPFAEHEVHDVPVLLHEHADTDETPYETADDNKRPNKLRRTALA